MKSVIDHLLAVVKAPLNHPLFYPRVFALVARHRAKLRANKDPLFRLAEEEFDELTRRLDRSQIQESTAVRNVQKTRQLAKLIIDEKGEINQKALVQCIKYFKVNLYPIGPNRQHDSPRQQHILKVLQAIHTQKDLVRILRKFSKPMGNKWAEELIKQTLQLPSGTSITDVHTKQAALAAWLCYLRQNVGSCFATAPAEIVHDEQPELFLQDLLDLISTGTLKRTFSGIEHSVPLSSSWGSGDLKKPLVIRIHSNEIIPEIWYSPGLLFAFESIGFLSKEESIKQKVKKLEKWLLPIIFEKAKHFFCVLSVEEVIRRLILNSLNLNEKQIKEFQERPSGMLHTQLMIQSPSLKLQGGGVGDKVAHFLTLFEIAKNSFKSLADNALLKAWEFTLASFSDTKYEFAKWNLYASLGLQTNEPHGIGQCIYQTLQHKLNLANEKVKELQYEYEMAYAQIKGLETRMRHSSSEKELQWLKIDYQSRMNEFYFLEEQRNGAQREASSLVDLYDTLYKLYVELFKDYFQEVYDADMQEVSTAPFDDSPAGFRLLYKHGRSNTSQWTRIKNPQEFIDSLASFFVATEPQIAHSLNEKKIEKDLSDVVTAIINHVKTKEFLESALHRMAAAHRAPLIKDPLDHLDQIEKKPWVYTSGGTMNTLVSCYYRIEDRPKEAEKWVESETELLLFIADTLKNIPPRFLEPFLTGKRDSLLMQSPTHAFVLKPNFSPFNEIWKNNDFTYTYVRDRWIKPAEMFIEKILLTTEMVQYLLKKIEEKIPENFQHRFKTLFSSLEGPLNPIFFREFLNNILEEDRGLRYANRPVISADEIDGLLYSLLPLIPLHQMREKISMIFNLLNISNEKIESLLDLSDKIPFDSTQLRLMDANQLQDICKSLICLQELKTSLPLDYHFKISMAAQKLGFAMPPPLIFADSNWMKELFGFVVNPGTGKLELWRLDWNARTGFPMSSWKQWVDGSRPDLRWGIYIKPFEYGQY